MLSTLALRSLSHNSSNIWVTDGGSLAGLDFLSTQEIKTLGA